MVASPDPDEYDKRSRQSEDVAGMTGNACYAARSR